MGNALTDPEQPAEERGACLGLVRVRKTPPHSRGAVLRWPQAHTAHLDSGLVDDFLWTVLPWPTLPDTTVP